MGLVLTKVWQHLASARERRVLASACERRILMLGLDGAGKTTVLYSMKLGRAVTTIPTIGCNVETLQHKNVRLAVWDIGGHEKLRRGLWHQYLHGTEGLIFVVDSSSAERMDDARKELLQVLLDEGAQSCAPLLVLANKQDLPHAMAAAEVSERLGLHGILRRQWFVQSACATSGVGLLEGLDWLSGALCKE